MSAAARPDPPAAPPLSSAARASGAARALAARRRRREIGESVRAGRLTVADVVALVATDEAVAAMRVSTLLGWLPGYGPARVTAALAAAQIEPDRRLRRLGHRQCAALATLGPRPGRGHGG